MGRSKHMSESGDTSLRRSTRKRILKKNDDFEYDFDDNTQHQSYSSEVVQIVKKAQKRSATMYKPKVNKSRRVETVPEPAAFEEVRTEHSEKDDTESSFESNQSDASTDNYNPKVIVSARRREIILKHLVKLESTDLARMEEKEIIDVHCDNLMRRLEGVAHSYLETWTIPCPVFCPPNVFLGGNPKNYSTSESDEVAVKKVVQNMLNAISSVN